MSPDPGPEKKSLPESLRERLRDIESMGVITGAGVSQESGISTYRGSGGIYDDPEAGDRTVEALSGPTFARDPDRTWRELARLARMAESAAPNPGHLALAEIERALPRFVLLTQNVDGLHQEAGSRNVIAIHGNIFATQCQGCGDPGHLGRETLRSLRETPRCRCGGRLRPGVVLFGEMLPPRAVERMREEFHRRVPDVVLAAGTSALFPYIVEPVLVAAAAGKLTMEVNPERSELSDLVSFHLAGRAGEILPRIAACLASRA